MKFISALCFVGMMLVSQMGSADGNPNKFLEPHQTMTVPVSVSAGKSTIQITASGAKYVTLLTCVFYDASGNASVKQEHTIMCHGDTPNLVRPSIVDVKVTNEADEKVQYGVYVGALR